MLLGESQKKSIINLTLKNSFVINSNYLVVYYKEVLLSVRYKGDLSSGITIKPKNQRIFIPLYISSFFRAV